MIRQETWLADLMQEIESVRDNPFVWGEHDCCLFAARCVEVMTGENPMPEFIGKYKSQAQAFRALKEIGEGTLLKTLKKKFGKPIHPAHAKRGDIMFKVFEEGGPAIGINLGVNSVFTGQEGERPGLVEIPTLECSKGFSIG